MAKAKTDLEKANELIPNNKAIIADLKKIAVWEVEQGLCVFFIDAFLWDFFSNGHTNVLLRKKAKSRFSRNVPKNGLR
jgi:hypothetical protein